MNAYEHFPIYNILYVPQLLINLYFVDQLTTFGPTVSFSSNGNSEQDAHTRKQIGAGHKGLTSSKH